MSIREIIDWVLNIRITWELITKIGIAIGFVYLVIAVSLVLKKIPALTIKEALWLGLGVCFVLWLVVLPYLD